MSDISSLKQQLRKELRAKRKRIPLDDHARFSQKICAQVSDYLDVTQAKQLLVYKALSAEVNTDDLLVSQAYETYVPRMLSDTDMQWVKVDANTQWKEVSFGVLEPEGEQAWKPNAMNTVLLCPLLGFDKQGNRLGMGKGYFDRWLAQNGHNIEVVGLAFSCQALSKVPVESHDVPLATIITEKGIISCPTT